MSSTFIAGLPAQGGALVSADVRNNLEALNDRTDKLTVLAAIPASATITVGTGIVYFQGRIPVNFAGAQINLGDPTVGVLPFYNIGYFKDIVIVLRLSLNTAQNAVGTNRFVATALFLEGPEKASSAAEPDLVQIRSTDLPVASFVVRHNGIGAGTLATGLYGEIMPITQASIVDYRNYIDVGGIAYASSVVGDRQVVEDAYGTVVLDGYGNPLITGSTVGEFEGTSAIQSAINSVSSAGGGTVLIRKGSYTPTSTIIVPSSVQIIGEGVSTVIHRTDTYSGPLFSVIGNNVVIANLYIIGPTTTVYATSPLVTFTSVQQCTIQNCVIDSDGYADGYGSGGLTAISYSTSTRNICTNNFIYNASIGVSLSSNSSKNLISNNQFQYNNTDIKDVGTGNISTANVSS